MGYENKLGGSNVVVREPPRNCGLRFSSGFPLPQKGLPTQQKDTASCFGGDRPFFWVKLFVPSFAPSSTRAVCHWTPIPRDTCGASPRFPHRLAVWSRTGGVEVFRKWLSIYPQQEPGELKSPNQQSKPPIEGNLRPTPHAKLVELRHTVQKRACFCRQGTSFSGTLFWVPCSSAEQNHFCAQKEKLFYKRAGNPMRNLHFTAFPDWRWKSACAVTALVA